MAASQLRPGWYQKGEPTDKAPLDRKVLGRRKHMANKRPKPEEIVTKLRQVEVLTGQGMPRLDAIRQIGVTERMRRPRPI